MLTRDQIMEFFRNVDQWDDTVHELSTIDKLELIETIASSVNETMETLAMAAINEWYVIEGVEE